MTDFVTLLETIETTISNVFFVVLMCMVLRAGNNSYVLRLFINKSLMVSPLRGSRFFNRDYVRPQCFSSLFTFQSHLVERLLAKIVIKLVVFGRLFLCYFDAFRRCTSHGCLEFVASVLERKKTDNLCPLKINKDQI